MVTGVTMVTAVTMVTLVLPWPLCPQAVGGGGAAGGLQRSPGGGGAAPRGGGGEGGVPPLPDPQPALQVLPGGPAGPRTHGKTWSWTCWVLDLLGPRPAGS